jgi:predicted DNA-binding ribbon-helix-helix protein
VPDPSPPTPPLKGRGNALVKGSVTIAGHRTSLSLEPVFWTALRAAAVERGQPLNALVAEIDEARTTNLSSAIRVWLFARASQRLREDDEG